jgi:hypothetical protein
MSSGVLPPLCTMPMSVLAQAAPAQQSSCSPGNRTSHFASIHMYIQTRLRCMRAGTASCCWLDIGSQQRGVVSAALIGSCCAGDRQTSVASVNALAASKKVSSLDPMNPAATPPLKPSGIVVNCPIMATVRQAAWRDSTVCPLCYGVKRTWICSYELPIKKAANCGQQRRSYIPSYTPSYRYMYPLHI